MQTAGSPQYNLSQIAMTLAAIAYAVPSDISTYLASTEYATNAQWTLVWGPGQTPGNLMYVVKNNTTDTYAIAIRGTYPKFSLALLVDLYEDLDVGEVSTWSYPPTPGALVANGTLDGLSDLITMQSEDVAYGQTLLDFVENENNVPAGATILVTGHSLGGCLSTVLAPWLQFQFSQSNQASRTVVPFTFAAPTAGNQQFADTYNSLFPTSQRYYNSLDVIPNGFATLDAIKNLYPSPGPPCPLDLKVVIDFVNEFVLAVAYVQTNGNGSLLPGRLSKSATDFDGEASHQHGHNTYLKLLGAPKLPFVVATVPTLTRTSTGD